MCIPRSDSQASIQHCAITTHHCSQIDNDRIDPDNAKWLSANTSENPGVPSIRRMYCRAYLPDGLLRRDTAFPIAGHAFGNRIGAEWHSRCRSGTLRLMIRQLDPPPGSVLAGHKQVHKKCYGVPSVLRIYVCCRGSADCTIWDVSAYHEVPGGG
jgi:hypothetical protein